MNVEKPRRADHSEHAKASGGASQAKKDGRASFNVSSSRGKCPDLRATAVSPTYCKNFFSTSTPQHRLGHAAS